MSTLLLYADEDACEHAVIQGLRNQNIDILTTITANQCGTDDPGQLAFAASIGRALYTFNAGDFARLHNQYLAQGKTHAGIIIIPDQRYSIGEKIRHLIKLVNSTNSEEMINQIKYL